MTVVHDAVAASAKLIAATRADLGMSRAAFGAMIGRSEGTIRRYEDRAGRPPAIFFHNLIEAEPGCGLRFNDFAPALGFRRIESMNPDDYGSIHEYFLGVRVLHRRSRMSFAAMLSVSATHLAAVEHRIKPEPQLVQRLARLFLRPHYNYSDVVRRFRALRPDPRALRLRGMFRELRDPQTAGHERSRLRADLIGDNADLARRLAKREARYLPEPGDAANAWTTALVKAVDGHDPRYGDFVPYLRKWIFGEVRHEARREWQSGTSATLRASAARISRARDDLLQQLRREPTPAEIATHLRLPVTAVADALDALAARHSRPLELDLAAPTASAQVTGFSAAMQTAWSCSRTVNALSSNSATFTGFKTPRSLRPSPSTPRPSRTSPTRHSLSSENPSHEPRPARSGKRDRPNSWCECRGDGTVGCAMHSSRSHERRTALRWSPAAFASKLVSPRWSPWQGVVRSSAK